MGVVERLLAAGEVELRPVDPEHPDARRCVAAYFAELDARSDGGFDPANEPAAMPAPADHCSSSPRCARWPSAAGA